MNSVTLLGRLTRDPELKFSQSGKAFCKFSIAVQRDFKKDEADFINCIAWDKRAELLTEYLRKGRRIALQGRLNVRNYDQNGETKWITEVIIDKFDFLDSSSNSDNNSEEKREFKKKQNDFDRKIDSVDNDPLEDDFPF